jgi:hypothetical protein
MQRYAELREQGDATSLQRRKILEDHQAAIASQIIELQRAHELLTHKISNYKIIEERIRIVPMHAEAEIERALEPVG